MIFHEKTLAAAKLFVLAFSRGAVGLNRGIFEDFDSTRSNAIMHQIDFLRGLSRNFDNLTVGRRPAIIDSYDDALAVIDAHDLYEGAEGKSAMRGGELIGIITLAARCFCLFIGVAVP